MRRSEYETQAFIQDSLNQQHALDSQEGSAALLQANKPQVDGTDIQKSQFLADIHDKSSTSSNNEVKLISHEKNPIQSRKSVGKVQTNKILLHNDFQRMH